MELTEKDWQHLQPLLPELPTRRRNRFGISMYDRSSRGTGVYDLPMGRCELKGTEPLKRNIQKFNPYIHCGYSTFDAVHE